MTKAQILAELKGAPSPRVEQVGPYWQIGFAWVSGARKDGIGLARDLMAKYRNEGGLFNGEPVPVEIPAFLKDPEPAEPDPRIDLQAARIAELEAELEAQKARSTDMFDAADLTDLIRESEPHAEAQRRWRLQYTQLNNRLVDTRLPPLSEAERALLNRLQRALYSGRRGAVETV